MFSLWNLYALFYLQMDLSPSPPPLLPLPWVLRREVNLRRTGSIHNFYGKSREHTWHRSGTTRIPEAHGGLIRGTWEAFGGRHKRGHNSSPPCPSDFPSGSDSKASTYNAGDPGSVPGLGRSPGEGNGNPLQYSCLENSMDGGTWWAAVHGVPKSWTWLSDFTFTLPLSSMQTQWLRYYLYKRNHQDWKGRCTRLWPSTGRSMVEGRCFCPMLWKKRVVSLYKVNSRVFSLGDHMPYFAGDSPSITSFVLV